MTLTFYILRHHAAPFLFSLFTLTFIFVLQFLMKFADRLIGKGLDTLLIIQLIGYNLAWMVVLVVPMAVLVSTLMAFGALSQNNEITVMKSSGISLYKMMLSPVVAGIIVGYLLIVFNNDILPDANHRAKILMNEISQKKPTLSLEPNVFSQEIPNHAMLAREINPVTNKLAGLTIYDYNNPAKVTIVTADSGLIYFTPDQTKLMLDLKQGEIHETDPQSASSYRKMSFLNHRIAMDASQFSFQQSESGNYRGERELSAEAMLKRVDSLNVLFSRFDSSYSKDKERGFFGDTLSAYDEKLISQPQVPFVDFIPPINNELDSRRVYGAYSNALNRVKTTRSAILSSQLRTDYINTEISRYAVEIHKKYSLPVACLVFVLLGAPLGVMTRKGGFGIAASISLFFFLVYWAFLIGGEKLADRGLTTPFWGMWSANIVLGALAAFLVYRTAKENVTLDFSFFKRFVPKQFRNTEPEEEQQ